MKPLKILIVHELFMPHFAGGGEKLVYEMAKNLKNAGHEIKVLTTGNPKIKSFDGITTIRLSINRYLMNFAIPQIIKHAKWADIIQTSTYNACLPSWAAGKILKKPVCCLIMSFWSDRWFEMRGKTKGWFSKTIESLQVKRSFDKTIFLSDFSKNFAERKKFIPKNPTVINPGVDIKEYTPQQKENFVLFSARFARQKGVYDALKVAAKLPNIKFVMAGWGKEEKEMRKKATPNVEFKNLRLKDGEKFFEMYGKAPLFFLPSYGETFGFVLVEAMASGCSIVSTIPLGFKGEVTELGNIEQMVNAIKKRIDNPQLMEIEGKNNQELAKKFNWENFTKKLVQEYEEILNKKT